MTWSATTDTRDVAEGLLGFARSYAEHQLASLPGVNFIMSALTGVQNNSKRKGGAGTATSDVRPGLGFIVSYSPSETTNNATILDKFQRLGLTNTPYEPIVKEVSNNLKEGDGTDKTVGQCCTVLKDHNSKYVADLQRRTVEYCAMTYPDITICLFPVNLCIVNSSLRALLAHSYDELRRAGVSMGVCNITGSAEVEVYRTAPAKGVDKAMEDLLEFMREKDLVLRKGHVYAKALGAKVTYVPVFTAESFVYRALASPLMRGKISINHVKPLATHLSHPDFAMIPQLEINYDLIEVNGNKCWDLSKLRYVDTPIGPEMIGKLTPRAFHPMEPTIPIPKHFIETVTNSFPETPEKAHFLLKWYQLLFCHRHFMKTRCLLVHGVRDCGKTSIVNPILQLIPPQYHASITCEKNAFATSMIKPDTQLVFVDEFDDTRLDASVAKQVLQGGYATFASKHKTGSIFQNHAMFYFTSQREPNWGPEDGNVKRRLTIFQMKPLQTVIHNVSQWLTDNAIPCIIWAGVMVRRTMEQLPLTASKKQNELFFYVEDLPRPRNSMLLDNLQKRLAAVADKTVHEDETSHLHELFNNEDDGNSNNNVTPVPSDSQCHLTPPSSPPGINVVSSSNILANLPDSVDDANDCT